MEREWKKGMNIVCVFDVLRIAVVVVGFVDAFHGTTCTSNKLFVSTFEYDDSNYITNRRYQRRNNYCQWDVNDRRQSSSFQLYATTRTTKRSDDDDDDDDDSDSSVVNYEYFQLQNNRYDFNRQKNKEWLMERFKFPKKRLDQQSHNYPFLTNENSILEGRADYFQQTLNFSDEEMNKLIQYFPLILNRKIGKCQPTLDCLESSLKLDKNALKDLILKNGSVLGVREEDIIPRLESMKSRLNLDDSKLRKVIQKNPSILSCSIDNIIAKIDYLNQRLNPNDGTADGKINFDLTDEKVSTIILKNPTILTYTISGKLEPTLNWLQQQLSLSNRKLANMIERYPSLLGFGISSNIEPTFNFFVDALGNDKSAAAAMISNNPRMLGTSLKNRLIPRLGQVKDAGLTIDQGCLTRIAQYKPEDWDASLTYQCRKLDKEESNGDKELW